MWLGSKNLYLVSHHSRSPHFILFLSKVLSVNMEVSAPWTPPVLWLRASTAVFLLFLLLDLGSWDGNSGPQACLGSTRPTKPSLRYLLKSHVDKTSLNWNIPVLRNWETKDNWSISEDCHLYPQKSLRIFPYPDWPVFFSEVTWELRNLKPASILWV